MALARVGMIGAECRVEECQAAAAAWACERRRGLIERRRRRALQKLSRALHELVPAAAECPVDEAAAQRRSLERHSGERAAAATKRRAAAPRRTLASGQAEASS
ncbi:hypothetical protein C2W62_31330 [Candidatus Entotheonella serta]|nr:hypothetical protein C2W62_31330 [Candidatus Entotheonella serta]